MQIAKQGLCPLSVCLYVPAWTHSSKTAAADLLLWAREAGDIDQLLQHQRANAGSATLLAYVVAEYRLVSTACVMSILYHFQLTKLTSGKRK